MRKKITDSLFCLWDCKNREAGSGEINGKMRSWDAAYQLIGVPVESSSARLWKYPVDFLWEVCSRHRSPL